MNDRDIFSDFLKDAKYKSQAYHMATVESANETIRDACLRFMNDELQNHRAIFHTMSSRGWYPVEGANRHPTQFQTSGGGYTQSPQPGPTQDPGPMDYRDSRRNEPQQPRTTGYEYQGPRHRSDGNTQQARTRNIDHQDPRGHDERNMQQRTTGYDYQNRRREDQRVQLPRTTGYEYQNPRQGE